MYRTCKDLGVHSELCRGGVRAELYQDFSVCRGRAPGDKSGAAAQGGPVEEGVVAGFPVGAEVEAAVFGPSLDLSCE